MGLQTVYKWLLRQIRKFANGLHVTGRMLIYGFLFKFSSDVSPHQFHSRKVDFLKLRHHTLMNESKEIIDDFLANSSINTMQYSSQNYRLNSCNS